MQPVVENRGTDWVNQASNVPRCYVDVFHAHLWKKTTLSIEDGGGLKWCRQVERPRERLDWRMSSQIMGYPLIRAMVGVGSLGSLVWSGLGRLEMARECKRCVMESSPSRAGKGEVGVPKLNEGDETSTWEISVAEMMAIGRGGGVSSLTLVGPGDKTSVVEMPSW